MRWIINTRRYSFFRVYPLPSNLCSVVVPRVFPLSPIFPSADRSRPFRFSPCGFQCDGQYNDILFSESPSLPSNLCSAIRRTRHRGFFPYSQFFRTFLLRAIRRRIVNHSDDESVSCLRPDYLSSCKQYNYDIISLFLSIRLYIWSVWRIQWTA